LSDPVWTRRIADEFWSGPVTPLTFTLLGDTMAEHMVRRTLRQAGLVDLADLPVLSLHASHVYVNGSLLTAVVNLLPPILRTDGLLQLVPPPLHARLEPTSILAATAQTATMALRFLRHEPAWAPWRRAAAFDRVCAAIRARFAQPRPAFDDEPAALYAQMRTMRDELGSYLETVGWGVVFAYVFYHLLQALCVRWAPDLKDERAALTVGLPGVASLEAAREIAALGRDVVRHGEHGPATATLEAILARHGHRLTGRDLSCPTWCELPDIVLDLARRAAAGPHATALAGGADRRRAATGRIEHALGRGIAGPARVAVFRTALAAAQRYYVVRENMRYYADFFLARLRDLALALGTHLASAGRLIAADDVFFLELDELGAVVRAPIDLGARARDRRETLDRDSATPPPVVLGPRPRSAHASCASPETARPVLSGESAAPGRCRGPARVVQGPVDFARFAPGDVLVAAYTDPAWTPILELAAGLVLDAGGQLSHGAIVARELGIPALVNVAGATRTLRDGDIVEIDTATGMVRVVDGT